MHEREPSKTAFAAAAHRAAHQVLEHGRIFADPLAVRILGLDPDVIGRQASALAASRGMRLFIAARSACAERILSESVEARGVRQVVVLGAGLDTLAYRHGLGDRVRVFEVDHPATQAWKRRRLAEAAIDAPPSLVFAPADFERQDLADALPAAGFDPAQRSFFIWLGVVPYLTRSAITATLRMIAGLPGGGEVVFDYGEPPERLSGEVRTRYDERAARVAAMGEPFLTAFDPDALRAELEALGFQEIEDVGTAALLERRAGPGSPAAQRPANGRGHVVHASTP